MDQILSLHCTIEGGTEHCAIRVPAGLREPEWEEEALPVVR